jgi:hypothetical protein
MSKHAQSNDTRNLPVLNLRDLTVAELGALVDTLREAQIIAGSIASNPAVARMWQELCVLRMEVRSQFVTKFFEIERA